MLRFSHDLIIARGCRRAWVRRGQFWGKRLDWRGMGIFSRGVIGGTEGRLANRLQAMGQANYRNGFEVTLQPQMLELPLKWKSPKRIFVNSMSDLFHAEVPFPYIRDVFDIMRRAHWHQYQVLTKRSERLMELSEKFQWEPQIWMGVSVENEEYTMRIDHLRQTDAQVKFLSVESLLGPLRKLEPEGIDWVIVGGESGPGARPMDAERTGRYSKLHFAYQRRIPSYADPWAGPFAASGSPLRSCHCSWRSSRDSCAWCSRSSGLSPYISSSCSWWLRKPCHSARLCSLSGSTPQ